MQYKLKKDNEECVFSVKQITFLEKILGKRVNGCKWLSCEVIYSGKKKEKKAKAEPSTDELRKEAREEQQLGAEDLKEENTPAPPKEETQSEAEERP